MHFKYFSKYLHLHLRFSNEKYLHLKKNQILFKYIQIHFANTIYSQVSRLHRPGMLNTHYFRFVRKFRLSVRRSGRDFYEENISTLEANFGWQEA